MKKVHIIGGGIMGLCSAYYLSKEGCEVTVIDRGDYKDGTSHGNAGMIVPSHFVPMATPGVISQGLKWMLDSKSPFYIRPRLNGDLIQWLWQFYKSANTSHVHKAMPVLYRLNESSKLLYRAMAQDENFPISYEEKGLLMLYKTDKQEEEEAHLAEEAKKLGVPADIMSKEELKRLEPEVGLDVKGGIYFPGDAHLYPNHLMDELYERLQSLGTTFISNTSVVDLTTRGDKVESIRTDGGELIAVDNIVVSSGSWTAQLLKKVGIKMHLQDGKGYSITMKKPSLRPRIPTILSEAKVAITPMGDDLRIGGTLELSGLSDRVDARRVQGIMESVPQYYKNVEVEYDSDTPVWRGYRPCSPDGLPYIGKAPSFSNLFVGTGHGMMGLSLGAITGKLMSEIVLDRSPSLDVTPFRLGRF